MCRGSRLRSERGTEGHATISIEGSSRFDYDQLLASAAETLVIRGRHDKGSDYIDHSSTPRLPIVCVLHQGRKHARQPNPLYVQVRASAIEQDANAALHAVSRQRLAL